MKRKEPKLKVEYTATHTIYHTGDLEDTSGESGEFFQMIYKRLPDSVIDLTDGIRVLRNAKIVKVRNEWLPPTSTDESIPVYVKKVK